MIDAEDLLYHLPNFLNERHLEKDYLQYIVLNSLYSEFSAELVFKGGTALQKIYGLGRFSEDLDFTYNGTDFESDTDRLKRVLKGVDAQYPFVLRIAKQKGDSLAVELRNMRGPLYSRKRTPHLIKIDVSAIERVTLKPELKYVAPAYADIAPFSVYAMPKNEILAEKIRAVYTRTKARDIYDTYFLLRYRNATFEKDLADAKLKINGIKFGKASLDKKLKSIGNALWRDELSNLLKVVPDYDEVVAFLNKTIK